MTKLLKRIATLPFSGVTPRLALHLDLLRYCKRQGWPRLALLVTNRMQRKFGVFISPRAGLSETVRFPHPAGIVIGDGVAIGEGVVIYQNVTIGGARVGDLERNHYPQIGDGSVVFAGAVIIGKVRIGRNCVIGANSVVLTDLPDDSTAVGAPARILRCGPAADLARKGWR
ncbi:MAG: serine acetyltransferase [Candidatus Accumulibacter sp. UW20]|jgi:serine O-acetyltransferase